VPSAAAQANKTIDEDEVDNLAGGDEEDEEDDVDMDESQESSEEDEPEVVPEELAPLRTGLGMSAGLGSQPQRGGIGSSNMPSSAGLGSGSFARAGLGAQAQSAQEDTSSARQPRSFLAASTNSNPNSPKPATPLTNDEKRHFSQLEKKGGIGFKLLSKMGWTTGTGLGSASEGRINPVDQQLRPTRLGIGHGGFKEKTKQSIQEARR
jgi:tuftelin-interacting protein 11